MMVIMALVTTFMTTPLLSVICPKELLENVPDTSVAKPPAMDMAESNTQVA
jgi:hypothetical protein